MDAAHPGGPPEPPKGPFWANAALPLFCPQELPRGAQAHDMVAMRPTQAFFVDVFGCQLDLWSQKRPKQAHF